MEGGLPAPLLHLSLPLPAPIDASAPQQLRYTFGHGIPFPKVLRTYSRSGARLGAANPQAGVEKTAGSMATRQIINRRNVETKKAKTKPLLRSSAGAPAAEPSPLGMGHACAAYFLYCIFI